MKTKEVTYAVGGEVAYRVVVQEATALIGIRRTRRRMEGAQETDLDRRLLYMYSYADCMAAVVETEGLEDPLPFDKFAELPDSFVGDWERAVYDLNPHWVPKAEARAEEESTEDPKQPSSTGV